MTPPPSPDDRTTALDPGQLAQLRQLEAMHPGTLATIAQLFLEQAERRLAKIDREWAAGDARAVADAAHALKGSAHTIGAREVAALATKIEAEARAGRDTGDLIAALREALTAIRPAIEALARAGPH